MGGEGHRENPARQITGRVDSKGKYFFLPSVVESAQVFDALAMKASAFTTTQTGFDLARLTNSKESVDLAPNTIRKYCREGLSLYRKGRAVFFSKSELEAFIRSRATVQRGGGAT
jgi:hypothetical protein